MLVLMPTIMYPTLNFATTYVFKLLRIQYVMYICAALQIIGCWLRALSFAGDGEIWLMLLGTFIFLATQTLCMNSISTIANTWFSENEIGQSTAISSLVMPVGSIVGLGLAGVVAAGIDVDDPVECMDCLKQMVYI